jgi:hypothetical protein
MHFMLLFDYWFQIGNQHNQHKEWQMGMIGANLEAMGTLSDTMLTTGESFNARSEDIVKAMDVATKNFQTKMGNLKTETDQLAEQIRGEMTRLSQNAAAIQWTGDHQRQHAEVLKSLDDEIVLTKERVEKFSSEAKGVVDGQLTSFLNTLSTDTKTYGSKAMEVATSFHTGVSNQRQALHEVMNG